MKLGDKGLDVVEAQQWLISIGYLDDIEFFYSTNTVNAVKQLERDLGITPTGEFYEELKYIYELKLLEVQAVPSLDGGANIGIGTGEQGIIVDGGRVGIGTGEIPTIIGGSGNSNTQATFNDYLKNQQEFPCYIVNLLTNNEDSNGGTVFIPHIPEEFSYTKGNVFEEQMTKGRSEPFQGYTGSTAVTTNVSFVVTADYAPNNDIDLVLNKLEALCYPRYGSIVKPPKAFFRCGTFTTEGIVTELTITRRLPIIDGKYSQAEVNISFTETHAESVSASEVGVAGWRG